MVQVRGIAPLIDGCDRLLHKQSNQLHDRLPIEHKRWIDLEDVLQESLLAAWKAEQAFTARWGSDTDGKTTHAGRRPFSTWMAYGVRNQLSQVFASPLSQHKRVSAGMASISDPLPGTDSMYLEDVLESPDPSPEEIEMGVECFGAIGRRLGAGAGAVFVTVFSFGIWPNQKTMGSSVRMQSVLMDIRRAAVRRRTGFEQMVQVSSSKLFKIKTLTLSSEFTKMRQAGGHDLKVLDCVSCRDGFSLKDVEDGRFEPETLTCRGCYERMAASGASISCFGKLKTKKHEGFDLKDPECRLHCMDRNVCKRFVETKTEEGSMTTEVLDEVDILDDEDTAVFDGVDDDGDEPVAKAAKKSSAKKSAKSAKAPKAEKAAKPTAAKTAKTAKAAKAPKTGEDRDLPFKKSSTMRYCLEQALDGIKVATLEKTLKEGGYNVAFQMKMLRSGQSNGKGLMPYPVTHTWTITEENGHIKAHNVKRIATFEKLERVKGAGTRKVSAVKTTKAKASAAKKSASKKKTSKKK